VSLVVSSFSASETFYFCLSPILQFALALVESVFSSLCLDSFVCLLSAINIGLRCIVRLVGAFLFSSCEGAMAGVLNPRGGVGPYS
jgi:hypothetical protein